MNNVRYDDAQRDEIRAQYPELRQQVHKTFGGHYWEADERPFFEVDEQEREAMIQALWEDGSLRFWVGSFSDLFTDEKVSEAFSKFVADQIRARVDDPATAEKLIPRDHGFGTRRVPLEVHYFEAYNRDNVTLVDVNEDPIERVDATGVATSTTHHDLDILICASGFDAATGAFTAMDIRGRNGRSLGKEWQEQGISNFLGLQVNGYPNLFMVMGPLSPAAAFCNVPTCSQQQVEWITDCVSFVRNEGLQAIEPKVDAEAAWGEHHDEVAGEALVTRTDSWYTGANIEGKPRRLLAYIGGVPEYQAHCDQEKDSGYARCELIR